MTESHRVVSSSIESVSHEDDVLTVEFKNGRFYEYAGVPRDVFDDLLAAPSAGRFLNDNVKGVYPFKAL